MVNFLQSATQASETNLIDRYARRISYLRVSVTDRCDFRCNYCMAETMTFLPKAQLLTLEELDSICSCFIELGVQKLRVTGGEPLVRRNILDFFKAMGRHLQSGTLRELTLTTNGSQLAKYAEILATCGVKRVNVSLDSLVDKKFTAITRRGRLSQVINGIEAALAVGLRVKINTVALKGVNENEIIPLVEWCASKDLDLTFIEVMPMGDITSESRLDQYLPLTFVRQTLEKYWDLEDIPLRTGGPARYVQIQQTGQKIGFITPLSHNFCESCNRVRLTCTGILYQCLGQENQYDLRRIIRAYPNNQAALIAAIRAAIALKPKGHDFNYSHQKISGLMPRYMNHTGG